MKRKRKVTKTQKPINEKAMLIRLRLGRYRGTKTDREVSKETRHKYKAESQAGHFTKSLFAKEKMLGIRREYTSMKDFVWGRTLPWRDDGYRILLSKTYPEVTKGVQERMEAINAVVDDFFSEWDVNIEEAKKFLAGMFDINDYPTMDDIKRKFYVYVSFHPISVAGDFRVDLNKGESDRIKKQLESEIKEIEKGAILHVWSKLYEVVEKMVDRLSDKDAVFRNSLVDNIVELTQLLPKINLSESEDLEKMRRDIESKLCSADAKDLRRDKGLRKETAKSAKDILNKMAGFMD